MARGFSEEFARIGFHPQIDGAIEAAGGSRLALDVGIHLRAGDHIFGRHRLMNRFWDKAVPAPIARELIIGPGPTDPSHRLRPRRRAHRRAVRDYRGGRRGGDAADPVSDRSAEAMFDLVRCRGVIASSPVTAGSLCRQRAIGDKQAEFHTDLVTPDESLEITRSDLERNGDRYHPLQRSFAWWVAYYRLRHDIPYAEAAEILEAAIEAIRPTRGQDSGSPRSPIGRVTSRAATTC